MILLLSDPSRVSWWCNSCSMSWTLIRWLPVWTLHSITPSHRVKMWVTLQSHDSHTAKLLCRVRGTGFSKITSYVNWFLKMWCEHFPMYNSSDKTISSKRAFIVCTCSGIIDSQADDGGYFVLLCERTPTTGLPARHAWTAGPYSVCDACRIEGHTWWPIPGVSWLSSCVN